MTHTSTEQQPELLMKLADDYAEACFNQGLHQRTTDDKPEAAREKLEKELRRLHARVQELEASQAQRVPLNAFQRRAIFDDLYPHGATSQMWQTFSAIVTAVERFDITQENRP